VKPQAFAAGRSPSDITSAELGRVETRQVRLSVSIPALMFLTTLLVMILVHVNVRETALGLPAGPAKDEMVDLAEAMLWAGVGGAFAAGGVGVLLAWQIVRPLRLLMRTMERFASGNLDAVPAVTRLGEIGSLGSAFNRMADQLSLLFRQRDHQIRESATGTVITLDENGRVVAADGMVGTVMGIEADQLLGKTLVKRLDALNGGNEAFVEALKRCLDEASRGLMATATGDFAGPGATEPSLLSIKVVPLEAAAKHGPAVSVDVRDLTGMRGFYEQMQRADRLAAVGTLAAGIAHEIRNPLASVRAMSQLMLEDAKAGVASPQAPDYLARMMREIDRLDRLVTSIKDLASKDESPVVPVDLNRMLRETWEIARQRVDPDGSLKVDVVWELDETMPECPLEESRIHQALVNLMVNAMECLHDLGGGTMAISARHVPENAYRPIVVYLRNSSPDISPEQRDRLFEPFFTTKAEGTGLGLPIAYQIVSANNGVMETVCEKGMFEVWMRFPPQGRHARMPGSSSGVVPLPDLAPATRGEKA